MNTANGPQQTILWILVVDPRSVSVAIQVCDKLFEAVYHCGAGVFCLSPVIFEGLRNINRIQLNKCNKNLKADYGLPVGVKRIIRVPVTVGNKLFKHEFHVLENTETDCLPGLDFPESNQCDPLFSRMELRLDPNHSVRMYRKTWLSHQYGVSSRSDWSYPGTSRPYQNSLKRPKFEETTRHPQRCLRAPKQIFNFLFPIFSSNSPRKLFQLL